MSFQLRDRRVSQVGVIGAGHLGPDVALDMAKGLLAFRVPVVLFDSADEPLVAARARLERKIERQVAAGQLDRTQGEALRSLLSYTKQIDTLKQANVLVECVAEHLPTKRSVYERLESVCRQDALLLSTSAHLQADTLFSELRNPRRAAVVRYAYPADRNPMVEISPGSATSSLVIDFLELFYELLGKAPVLLKSRYGHALSPVLEAILLAGCLAVERGWATTKQVDQVCRRVLGHALGPFATMNVTGGTEAAGAALGHYGVRIMPWYHSPRLLKEQLRSGLPWDTAAPDETVDVPPALFERLSTWMLGAYLAAATEVLDARLIDLTAFDEALALGLAIRPAFSLMNDLGVAKALRIVERFAYDNSGVKISQQLREQARSEKPWQLRHVQRSDDDEIAVITIRRFRRLNTLSQQVLRQLHDHLSAAEGDPGIRGVVIRGFGVRAFVSGADVSELAALSSPEDAETLSRRGQAVMRLIERLSKPVVAAMGGLALGGGNELAMACHARIATRDQRIFAGQPEPKLGLIPAYGGTQRLPRLIDFAIAWRMLRTGEPLGSADALRLGLIQEEVAADMLRDRAVELAADIAGGRAEVWPIAQGPVAVPAKLPDVDLTGLSSAIDAILQTAVLDGARMDLTAGLELEARQFARCVATEDFRIGVNNFLTNGSRTPAVFVHR